MGGNSPGSGGPYHGKPGEVIDPSYVDVFRGGSDLTVNPGDVKLRRGLVQPTHGLSLDTDATRLAAFGGARKIASIPVELQVIQRGARPTHFEIVPKVEMTLQRFQMLIGKIVLL
jgi:hypothetical protein